jgi:HEAT repeat protein
VTVARLATTSLICLVTAAAALGCVIVLGRVIRQARDRRRARLAAPARRALLALAAGDDDPAQVDALVTLDQAAWRAVEGTAVAMLGKVRGEAYEALVTVFERRGAGVRALRELNRADPVRRSRSAEVLGNLARRESVPPLCGLLSDPDPDVRAVATRALGRIGDSAATQPLLGAVAGRRGIPPPLVAHAVLRLGTGAQPGLIAACDHFDPWVRATAVEVLGLAGAVTAADRVVRLLAEETDTEVRVRACTALGRMGTRSALAPLIEAAGSTAPAGVGPATAQAMGELGAAAAAPALAALLHEPHHHVAHAAAQSLLRLGAAGRESLREAVANGPPAGTHAQEALTLAALEAHRRARATGSAGAVAADAVAAGADR